MSSPRRPPVPGSGRRQGRDETPSGAVPRARRAPGGKPGGSTSSRGSRAAAPRSGSVPKVGGPASRPAAARTAGRPGPGRAGTPSGAVPRAASPRLPLPRMFTVRAIVFSLVLLLAFVLVYPTLASYLATRTEVEQLRAARDAAQAENADLEAELKRWDDDAYIVAQARERLSFVMPGETAFVVVDPETVPATGVEEGPVRTAADGATRPWYATVWESVQIAGELELDATTVPPAYAVPPAPPAPADPEPTPAG